MLMKCPKCGERHDHRADHKCKATVSRVVDNAKSPDDKAARPDDVEVADSVSRDVCPTCGRKRPLTPAEKQRNYRNRQKGK